jgi:hypothetical protein
LEGLLVYERATGNSAGVLLARRRGEEYLLERNLFRRKSTGEIIACQCSFRVSSSVHEQQTRFNISGD